MDNMKIWNAVRTPPQSALKEIRGGRLSGMTDISPQWRMQALTETFGPAGIGWTYETIRQWTQEGPEGQVGAFVNINLFICQNGEWSRGIPGSGGSMLIAKEKSGLHFSDEAFKMATTDAISVAAKALGVGSDVYMGQLDSKYQKSEPTQERTQERTAEASPERHGVNARIHAGLKAAGCKSVTEAEDMVMSMTTFKKDDGKVIYGKKDYRELSDKAASILADKLEKMKQCQN